MTTKVEKSVVVNVPVSTAYNQWTQFEDFPLFMEGVERVTQLTDDTLDWEAEIAGVHRRWTAKILEQVPDRKVAWAAVEGATNAGQVTFEDQGNGQCNVYLTLEYEPEGFVENLGDKLKIVEREAEGDLERFKEFIESEGYATGAWRGEIRQRGMGHGMTGAMGTESGMGTGMGTESGMGTGMGAESEYGESGMRGQRGSGGRTSGQMGTGEMGTTGLGAGGMAAGGMGVGGEGGTGYRRPGDFAGTENVDDVTGGRARGGTEGDWAEPGVYGGSVEETPGTARSREDLEDPE